LTISTVDCLIATIAQSYRVPLWTLENLLELTAWNYFRCRKEELTISTVDCLIATIAQSYRVPLWTLDNLLLP
jgi:predicted nucleic acid-binding protein